jgi:hypothetical protein
VTQANIDTGGSFSNTATFDTAETAPQTSAAAVTTITQTPAFTNVKTQTGGSNPVTAAGQTLELHHRHRQHRKRDADLARRW